MTPDQARAARALLDIKQDVVAEKTGISKQTISNAENGKTDLSATNTDKLRLFYETHGIEFTDYDGVRRKPSGLRTLKGRSGLQEMYAELYKALRRKEADIWLYNGVSHLVADTLGTEFVAKHKEKMAAQAGSFSWRVVVEEGDDAFWGHDYAHYRWIPKQFFNDQTIYVFGDCVGIVDFAGDVTIELFDRKSMAGTLRLFLETVWNTHAHDPDTEKPFRPA